MGSAYMMHVLICQSVDAAKMVFLCMQLRNGIYVRCFANSSNAPGEESPV